MLVLDIVGEENDQQFNAARRWGRYRRPRYVTVLTALPTFPQAHPSGLGCTFVVVKAGVAMRQIVGHHQENLAL